MSQVGTQSSYNLMLISYNAGNFAQLSTFSGHLNSQVLLLTNRSYRPVSRSIVDI